MNPLKIPFERGRTRRAAATGLPRGLHIGCGDRPIPGWFNGDISRVGGPVHYVDAARRLPFGDGSFEFVFSEHFIEHLSLDQARVFFRESHRVLKPGGRMRIATPDLRFARDLLEKKTETHVRYVEWLCRGFLPGQRPHAVLVVNHLFYGWGHRFIYDEEFLTENLAEFGYSGFTRHRPGESECEGLRGLEQHGKSVPPGFNEIETMVIEALKEK